MSGFGSIELGQPGNPVCPDQYNENSTLLCPHSTKALIQISSQSAYVQFGRLRGGGGTLANVIWDAEEPLLPMTLLRSRPFDAIRVRNFSAGHVAQVLITPQAAFQ